VLGEPSGRRARGVSAAARALGLPAPGGLTWADALDAGAALTLGGALRIEPPPTDGPVARELIDLGARALNEPPPAREPPRTGRLDHPRLWAAGFRAALTQLDAALVRGGGDAMNPPADIAAMASKSETRARLAAAGVPVAPAPPAWAACRDFDALYAALRADRGPARGRAFIKLDCGSAAVGLAALMVRPDGLVEALSPMRVQGAELFSALGLTRYRGEQTARPLVDRLLAEGAVVERWIPKAGAQGGAWDLRVVVIDGEARQVVMRLSDGPVTNLQAGGRRGDVAALEASLGPALWSRLRQTAVEAARAAAPSSLYCGVDLALTVDHRRIVVFEVNAFGDLLPGALHRGEDTWTAELRAATRRLRAAGPKP